MTDDELGIYYKCFRGGNSHFALSEPHSFNVNDAAGRDWICFPVPRKVVEGHDLLMDLVDVQGADEKSGEETVVRLVFCQDKEELASKLVEAAEEIEDE
jgi:hypothetical protein